MKGKEKIYKMVRKKNEGKRRNGEDGTGTYWKVNGKKIKGEIWEEKCEGKRESREERQ